MWGQPPSAVRRAEPGCLCAVPMIPEQSQSESEPLPLPSESRTSSPSPSDAEPLSEDLVLALLKRTNLLARDIEQLAKSAALLTRKVRLALAAHPRTPRRLALRLIRKLYTFDLMHFSQSPAAAADLKRAADELLVARLTSISLGERISLARRSSTLVAAALLHDKESRVWQTAMESPRLTEAAVVKALQKPDTAPTFVAAVCHHPKWSVRPEVRFALLRHPHTPLARAIEFARHLPPAQLRDVLHASRLPEPTKAYLREDLKSAPPARSARR
jgi:hypothetical protein